MSIQPVQVGPSFWVKTDSLTLLFFLSSVASVFLTVQFFISDLDIKPSVPAYRFETQNLIFTNQYEKERFEELLGEAMAAQDEKMIISSLTFAFLTLSSDYTRQPSSEKRQVLIQIVQYLKIRFPHEADNIDLFVPCREESCGAVFSYSDELTEIKNFVNTSSAIEDNVRRSILLSLDNAVLAAGSNKTVQEFNSLSSAFQDLKVIWKQSEDPKVKEVAEKVLTLMKKVDIHLYESASKRDFLLLN